MPGFTVRRFIYPLYQAVTGRRILSQWKDFEQAQWLTPQETKILQDRRFHDLLLHTYQHVPFYRARMESAGYNPVNSMDIEGARTLPLLNKEDILDYREASIADDFPRAARPRHRAEDQRQGHSRQRPRPRPDLASLDDRRAARGHAPVSRLRCERRGESRRPESKHHLLRHPRRRGGRIGAGWRQRGRRLDARHAEAAHGDAGRGDRRRAVRGGARRRRACRRRRSRGRRRR